MTFDFDTPIDRVATGSAKWSTYPPDVLPLWVADADFAVAPAIVDALRRRAAHPVFGYALPDDDLRTTIVGEMRARYNWAVAPDDIVFLPGVAPGFNMALRSHLVPGEAVTMFLPVYPPIHHAPAFWQLRRIDEVLRPGNGDAFVVDFDSFRRAMAQSKAFLFCNPHNPVGKVFTHHEIAQLAEISLAAGALIISDEVHCDLVYDGRPHVPMATLGPEVADRCITLMSASKTYNIPGLKCSFAIIQNAAIRQRFLATRLGMVDSVNAMGLAATHAAFAHGADWRDALLAYLHANRDYVVEAVRTRLSGVRMRRPEGTFLAWLDCTGCSLDGDPYDFFLKRAKVALNRGLDFGAPGAGHVRLNFGCPRVTLDDALGRMERALRG